MQKLDILKIKSNLAKKHDKFIKDLGAHSDRVLAEHNLMVELTYTRIKFICDAIVEMKIIDKVDFKKEIPIRKIYLTKDGYDNYVRIVTNGDRIVIDGVSNLNNIVNDDNEKIILDGATSEDFDWIKFSDQLLTVIHGIVYERKEALETKMFGIGKK